MQKLFIVALLLVCFFRNTKAQSQIENLRKYWFYRDRLTKCFTYVGDGPGESLVASQRGKVGQFDYGIGLDYGEDQTVHLGYYIAVLATEYAMLEQQGLDNQETKKELYYVLQAFNRIDYDAEWYYRGSVANDNDGNGYSDDLNGFFSRNDWGYSLFDPFDLNQPKHSLFHDNHKLEYMSNPGYSLIDVEEQSVFSWHKWIADPNNINNTLIPDDYQELSSTHRFSFEMSKDQINYILFGLAFIKKCVDADEFFNDGTGPKTFMDGETNFVQEAKNIAERLWNSTINQNADVTLFPYCIRNPVTNESVVCCGNVSGCFEGAPGGISIARYGYAAALSYITDEPISEYLGVMDEYGAKLAWQHSDELFIIDLLFNADNYSKVLYLAAIGHSLYQTVDGVPAWNNTQQQLCTGTHSPGVWGGYYDSPILPLVHAYLHDKELDCFEQSEYSTLLDQAPCEGPYNLSDLDNSPTFVSSMTCQCLDLAGTDGGYWSCENTFVWPDRRNEDMKLAEYNGLDYMLLFNLYSLYYGFPVYNDYETYYYNANNYKEIYDFPIQEEIELPGGQIFTIDVGSHQNSRVFSAFHTITSDHAINSGADLTYQYGDLNGFIELTPGFHTEPGSNFVTLRDPLTCNSSLNVYEKSATENRRPPLKTRKDQTYSLSNSNSIAHNTPQSSDSLLIEKKLIIYPNPATNLITIVYGNSSKYILQITDVSGKIIANITFKGPQDYVDIKGFSPGFYYLKIFDDAGVASSYQKLIIQ